MTATNHALTGAIIGAILPLPIAVPVAFISHFILDALPHYGIPLKQRNSSSSYKNIVKLDIVIALTVGVLAIIYGKWDMELAGWVAYSPDISWVVNYFKQSKSLNIKTSNWFMRFHRKIQWCEFSKGIYIEIALFLVLFPVFFALLQT